MYRTVLACEYVEYFFGIYNTIQTLLTLPKVGLVSDNYLPVIYRQVN